MLPLMDVTGLLDSFFYLPYLMIKFFKKIRTIFQSIKNQELSSPLYEKPSTSTVHIYQFLKSKHHILKNNLKEIKELPENLIEFINIINSENSTSFLDSANEVHMKVKKEFICPISRQIMSIPVSVGDHHYDLQSLLNLPVLSSGEREIPIIKKTFYLDEIKPNWDLKIKIQWDIKDAENYYLNKLTENSERQLPRFKR